MTVYPCPCGSRFHWLSLWMLHTFSCTTWGGRPDPAVSALAITEPRS
jgi:hypothetical protein